MPKCFLRYVFISCLCFSANVYAVTKITFWHAMAGSLGVTVNQIADEFNASQSEYQIVPIYKGDYYQTLTATVAAFRAHKQPGIVQVFEVGTATMTNPQGIIVPVYQLMQDAKINFNYDDILPAIRYYYADDKGQLLGMPFNSSSPVMFYNKAAFLKAGLDPNKPPQTWPELAADARKILKAGYECGFTTGWPSWIQLETFSAWHNLPFASANNGFSGLDARLIFNNPVAVKHVAAIANWQQEHVFQYGGREDDAMSLFTSGQCAMLMESSGSVPDLVGYTSFPVGIAPLPYWPDVKGAPQNTSIGGAALWALSGRPKNEYKGIAEFFAFLATPKIQTKWQEATGYLPITISAYTLSKQQGYYKQNPGMEVAIKELLNKPPTAYSHGFRLGNYMRIREIIEQELEAAWSGEVTAKQALDAAVKQGNELLEQFQQDVNLK